MRKKITWNDVYKDFKIRLPNLSKKVTYWKPRDYLSITVYFEDGSQMVYDYLYKKASFIVMPQVALA
jgi:hypothetical protein